MGRGENRTNIKHGVHLLKGKINDMVIFFIKHILIFFRSLNIFAMIYL